jgi:8-oxo-dGTP pyrophosphatase MutT (NUDIX family)
MEPQLLSIVAAHLPAEGRIAMRRGLDLPVPDERRDSGELTALAPSSCAAAVLIDDELSSAGDHAEGLVDAAGAALEPGGVLVATLRNRVHAEAIGAALNGMRGYSADEAATMLAHRGFRVELLCAPGAGAGLRGAGGVDLDVDRQPGLLDAAARLLVAARAPRSAEERGRTFFDSRPRKIAAAAVLCRDPAGRLLVVHDRFKRMWTIPGGVVDADEDPAAAAQREAWEEAGTRVGTGSLLGVFASRWPDRLVFVFEASPLDVAEHPEPRHPHEISAVRWVALDEALTLLAPQVAHKVRTCLDQPGFTWVQ